MAWKVIADPAYGAWIELDKPSFDAEVAMLNWLAALERQDDPPVERGIRRVGTQTLPWTDGPNGEEVIFKLAPHRIIGIIAIRSKPQA